MDSQNFGEISVEKRDKIPKRKFVIEDVILKDSEKVEPCLVQFANGVLKDESKIRGKLYYNASEQYKHKRTRRRLEVTGPRLTYVGKNFDDALDQTFQERSFLGVLDKETNKMKLIEISSFTLYPETLTKTSSTVTPLSVMSEKEKLRELRENFGGRRARTMIKKRDESQFDIEEMSSALNEATEKTFIDQEELELVEEDSSFKNILPPCNREAGLIHDVYKLEDIIPDVQLVLYNDDAMEYMEGNKDSSKMSLLFNQTIANTKLSLEEEEGAKIACIGLFTENLIQFLNTKHKMKTSFTDCPNAMQSKIFEMFSEGKSQKKTKLLNDKLVAHIIVLALLANQFELEWTTLCQSLGVQKERLMNIINVVGATVSKKDSSVKLKLPLAKLIKKSEREKKKRRK